MPRKRHRSAIAIALLLHVHTNPIILIHHGPRRPAFRLHDIDTTSTLCKSPLCRMPGSSVINFLLVIVSVRGVEQSLLLDSDKGEDTD
ncbi:hypothetical protein RRG08_034256 [Elysia crispata]|uniref:Secreted protein n=1 Tax=Elysia crispata TaxID=231223 RepID=A0AAE1A129_9GAST|nr:hypothetical protein RRG08_034256 [Elysia crispata]